MTITKILTDPTVITCYVKASEAVALGEFVKADASSSDVVDTTGLSSYSPEDIQISSSDAANDYIYTIGIAGGTCTATQVNRYIPVYTEGIFILKTAGSITTGYKIQKSESASQQTQVVQLDNFTGNANTEHCIGLALTGASASGKYIIALIRI